MSQRIHLDATPGLFHQVLHCHQGDVGRQFEIAVVTRDGYEIPSGATFKIQATKPSGLGFTVTGTAANNIISFTSTEDMTSEAGEIPTQLEIKSGNDVIYTSNFLLVCETNVHPSSVTDGSPEEIISEITLLVERAESAASTAGADAAAAAQARVDEMMNYLPTEVTNLKSDLGGALLADNTPILVDVPCTLNSGFIGIYGDVQSDSNSKYTKINVHAGEKYYVSCCITGNRSIAFYNGTTLLSVETETSLGQGVLNDYEFTMPTNCTVFGVTTYLYETYPLKIKKYKDNYIKSADILEEVYKLESNDKHYKDKVELINDVTWSDGYVSNTGSTSTSSNYKKTNAFAVNGGDLINIVADDRARFVAFFNDDAFVSGAEYAIYSVVPSGVNKAVLSYASAATVESIRVESTSNRNNALEYTSSFNLFDSGRYWDNFGMRLDGTVYYDTNGILSDFIPVEKNDKLYFLKDDHTSSVFSNVTAFDEDYRVLSDNGKESSDYYDVPDGVWYVRCTVRKTQFSNKFRINKSKVFLYDSFKASDEPKGTYDNNVFKYNVEKDTLSTLPEYIMNSLAYRPLGYLEKGYMCLVSDDGNHELATYAIPMLNSKNVPCTFALMSTSEVMGDSSEKAIVIDAIENHGCKVAQHGDFMWTTYNEAALVNFFDNEEAYFENEGIAITSGVCPAHGNNNLTRAIAGGRWGVCRTGYTTSDSAEYSRMNGPRSNLYALVAQGISEYELDYWKDQVDLAIANHYILIPFWHDNSWTSESKAKFEAVVDYAKAQNMQFVTLDEIPLLK